MATPAWLSRALPGWRSLCCGEGCGSWCSSHVGLWRKPLWESCPRLKHSVSQGPGRWQPVQTGGVGGMFHG